MKVVNFPQNTSYIPYIPKDKYSQFKTKKKLQGELENFQTENKQKYAMIIFMRCD